MKCKQALRTISTQSTTPKKLDISWRTVDTEKDSSDNEMTFSAANQPQNLDKLESINQLLCLQGHSPIQRTLKVGWVDATPKTQKYYVSKMEEVVTTVLDVIAPNDAGMLWKALKKSSGINDKYNEPTMDSTLLMALVESYKQATHTSTQKNILSIIADKLSFHDLEKLIPGISRHRFTAARRHAAQFGADALATQMGTKPTILRQRVDPNQVEHFMILSPAKMSFKICHWKKEIASHLR